MFSKVIYLCKPLLGYSAPTFAHRLSCHLKNFSSSLGSQVDATNLRQLKQPMPFIAYTDFTEIYTYSSVEYFPKAR